MTVVVSAKCIGPAALVPTISMVQMQGTSSDTETGLRTTLQPNLTEHAMCQQLHAPGIIQSLGLTVAVIVILIMA